MWAASGKVAKRPSSMRQLSCGVLIPKRTCADCARSEHFLAHERKMHSLTWRTDELHAEGALEDIQEAERWMAIIESCDATLRGRGHRGSRKS
jgi:hypothetical protein